MNDNVTQNNNNVTNGSVVGRDLIINQCISPEMIREPVENVMAYIRHRNVEAAQGTLDTLLSTSHIDGRAKGLLEALKILIEIAKEQKIDGAIQKMEKFLRTAPDALCEDIAISALIRLDINSKRLKEAEKRFTSLDAPGDYCKEIFLESIADRPTLRDFYSKKVDVLTEITLCGLVRGLLRCEDYELAIELSERLIDAYPSFNSEVIHLIIKFTKLRVDNSMRSYWLTSNSERRKFLWVADKITSLMDTCNGKDKRVIEQALEILPYLVGDHAPLVQSCLNNITNIELQNPDAARYLRKTVEGKLDGSDGVLYEINKVQKDSMYRNSVIQRLISAEEITAQELILFSRVAGNKTIGEWVKNGGKVASDDDLERDFLNIEIQNRAGDGSPASKELIKRAVDNFVANHSLHLSELNMVMLFDLTSRLLDSGLAHEVIKLLQPIVPTVDIWPSPIVRNYLRALLEGDQLTTLRNLMSEIYQDEWDDFIWQIEARKLDLIGDSAGAIAAIQTALTFFPLSLSCWYHYISLYKRTRAQDEYEVILKSIPEEIFSGQLKSETAWHLLFELSISECRPRAEKIIVSWFIENPDACAKAVTDLHFARAALGKEVNYTPVAETEFCVGGFNYLIDDQQTTKLIVRGVDSNHASILSSTSPLGELLLGLNVGESVQSGMQEVKLLERLPPYVGVFRVSLELRQVNNDGSDCFYSLKMPEDPDEMIASLEKKMASLESGRNQIILGDQRIPLFLKGRRYGGSCPVHAALEQLTKKETFKHPLPPLGETQPQKIIVDVYATVYLGLTGLINGLVKSNVDIYITNETRAYLKDFLRQINNDNYMRLGVNAKGRLWRLTGGEVRSQTADVPLAIEFMLENSKSIPPNLVDMPPDLLQIQEVVDASIYSSMRLSIANDIPWLCIDEMFAQLSFKSNYPVVNAFQFFLSLASKIEIEKKLPGLYLHACSGLPYPLTYDDLLQMASLNDENAQYFLAEILKLYPNTYPNLEFAADHLSKIVILSLSKAYIEGHILNGLRAHNPTYNGLAERIFNVCCFLSLQVNDGNNAERKLAFLLYKIFTKLKNSGDMTKLVQVLSANFIMGHFLNFDEINAGLGDYSTQEYKQNNLSDTLIES